MRTFSTLDFVILDEGHMSAFLNVMGRLVEKQKDSQFMSVIQKMKFKMKLGFECWKRSCTLVELVLQSIDKTLNESQALAISNL